MATPALKGRPPARQTTALGRRGSARTRGWSRPACRSTRGPFGDVGVRFGGSEHHQGRAPALRHHRATSVAGGRSPRPRSREAIRALRGLADGHPTVVVRTRFAVLFGGDANRPRTAPAAHGISVHDGLGRRGRTHHQALRRLAARAPPGASATGGTRTFERLGDWKRASWQGPRPAQVLGSEPEASADGTRVAPDQQVGQSGRGDRAATARRQRPQ
jgi:hypothetical protein